MHNVNIMAAVRSRAGKMVTKLNGNPTKRQEQAIMTRSDVDDDLDSESDVSEVASAISSAEENENQSVEEESEGEDENETSGAEMEEDEDEEGISANESEDSGDDEDTSDDEVDDDDADGETWMDVDDDENSDHSSSSDEEGPDTNGKSKLHGNDGWADAMAKILRSSKPKGKKNIVLAKAKKLSQVSASVETGDAKQEYGFEIDNQAEEEDVKPNVDELDIKPKDEELDVKPSVLEPIRRRDRLAEGKVKPSITDRERERALSKIATKGVVQLFNAVRQQQKTLSGRMKEAKGSIVKEDKVLKSIDKRAFLDVLMGAAPSEKVENYVQTKTEKDVKEEEPATWSVLRDNFLTGSNLKDWDKCGEIKIEDDADDVELN